MVARTSVLPHPLLVCINTCDFNDTRIRQEAIFWLAVTAATVLRVAGVWSAGLSDSSQVCGVGIAVSLWDLVQLCDLISPGWLAYIVHTSLQHAV